jgi:glutaredoxin 3
MSIIVYSKPGCPSCESAKRKLTQLNVQYEVKTLGSDISPDQMFEEFDNNGWARPRTAPQIVINGNLIGGYEAMLKYIEDTGFNGTGHSTGT